jgi:hypothetical protein
VKSEEIIVKSKNRQASAEACRFLNTNDNIDTTAHAVQKAVHTVTLIF